MAVRVHFLDVGEKEFGDAVVCQIAGKTVLIDGSHPGDWEDRDGHDSIPKQVRESLGVTGKVTVDLLVVSHAHDDHIGCLPEMVEKGLLSARWALVADPALGWGEPDSAPDAAQPFSDSSYGALISALREEPRGTEVPSDAIRQLLADARLLRDRYEQMLETLEADGCKVVRYCTDEAGLEELLAQFKRTGLRILGPSPKQTVRAAELMAGIARDLLRDLKTRMVLDGDQVALYRKLVAPDLADAAAKRMGHLINLQSLVLAFRAGGVALLFPGDMQAAEPGTADSVMAREVAGLLERIKKAKRFDLVKLPHHGSANGFDEEIFDEHLGDSTLLGISTGVRSGHHPSAELLKWLRRETNRLRWFRTDKNGRCTVTFTEQKAEVVIDHGELNDASQNRVDTALERPSSVATEVVAGSNGRVDVTLRLSGVSLPLDVSIELRPTLGAPGPRNVVATGRSQPALAPPTGDTRGFDGLLFVTSEEGVRRKYGDDNVTPLLRAVRDRGGTLYTNIAPGERAGDAARRIEEALPADARGVVLLGGYDLVPSYRIDSLPSDVRDQLDPRFNDDPDDFIVWSDEPYGAPGADGFATIPISRIPDAGSLGLLQLALAPKSPARARRYGIRNKERPFAETVFKSLLPGKNKMLRSGPTCSPLEGVDGLCIYLMLHGDYENAHQFEGEPSGTVAIRTTDVPRLGSGAVVFTGCCWGALTVKELALEGPGAAGPRPFTIPESMALTFLAQGAQAFIGCTGVHYSPRGDRPTHFGGPMHERFWTRYLDGASPAQALFLAKQDYRNGMPHGGDAETLPVEYKILQQYTCLGLGW
ncbi:MAG: ComEC/Rec2 family competence protein [Myxococcaceae bacterium]